MQLAVKFSKGINTHTMHRNSTLTHAVNNFTHLDQEPCQDARRGKDDNSKWKKIEIIRILLWKRFSETFSESFYHL